eukprot:scaffold109_cov252-Pinguiococcus_pyrenoidosus.AAC.9
MSRQGFALLRRSCTCGLQRPRAPRFSGWHVKRGAQIQAALQESERHGLPRGCSGCLDHWPMWTARGYQPRGGRTLHLCHQHPRSPVVVDEALLARRGGLGICPRQSRRKGAPRGLDRERLHLALCDVAFVDHRLHCICGRQLQGVRQQDPSLTLEEVRDVGIDVAYHIRFTVPVVRDAGLLHRRVHKDSLQGRGLLANEGTQGRGKVTTRAPTRSRDQPGAYRRVAGYGTPSNAAGPAVAGAEAIREVLARQHGRTGSCWCGHGRARTIACPTGLRSGIPRPRGEDEEARSRDVGLSTPVRGGPLAREVGHLINVAAVESIAGRPDGKNLPRTELLP